jgi:peptidoglycan hydrolase-like protein with peptidoglycan-binding domain
VRVLQKLLISNGYGVPVDGVFGPVTEIAVKAFQNRRRLSADGLVGQKTWSELTM